MSTLRDDFFLDPVPPEGWDQQETIVTYRTDPYSAFFHWNGQTYSYSLIKEAQQILTTEYAVKPMTDASIGLYYWYMYQIVRELSGDMVVDPFQGLDFVDAL